MGYVKKVFNHIEFESPCLAESMREIYASPSTQGIFIALAGAVLSIFIFPFAFPLLVLGIILYSIFFVISVFSRHKRRFRAGKVGSTLEWLPGKSQKERMLYFNRIGQIKMVYSKQGDEIKTLFGTVKKDYDTWDLWVYDKFDGNEYHMMTVYEQKHGLDIIRTLSEMARVPITIDEGAGETLNPAAGNPRLEILGEENTDDTKKNDEYKPPENNMFEA